MSWFRPAMIVVGCVCLGLASAFPTRAEDKEIEIRNAEGGLHDGWEQVIEIPAFKTPAGETVLRPAKLTLWAEQDWLSVRRNDADGAVEWQVALAHLVQGTVPVVDVDTGIAGLDLRYGTYFIRENIEWLRVLRQRKNSESAPWPKLSLQEPLRHNFGSAFWREKSVEMKGWRHNDWCWVTSGLPGDRYDIWLRLERIGLNDRGNRFEAGPRPVLVVYGDKQAMDEGDLFYAKRSLAEFADKALALQKLRKQFAQDPAPPIVASEWHNSSEASSLEKFRGNVVLLDFWGTWCGPCVANLPKVQALHEKYKDRGLIVIGVHSRQGRADVPAFLKRQSLSFPIAIDTGATAEGYGIESWPTYFLIDKSGKSPWGFSSALPSDEEIEKMLR